ncbi:MAG: DUF58 domain-containing protein [Leptospiraceae bacterium]|nr:DUF58 domain-containing protein [Leptospiraceae bacterium]MDW8307298.1 DUF58 domain-containing protein [Leptospiraceae bacterium]
MAKLAELLPYLRLLELDFSDYPPFRHSGQETSRRRGGYEERYEARPYRPGDDIRHIDWRLYARKDRLFVREGLLATRRDIALILDFSPSVLLDKETRQTLLLAALSVAYILWRKKNKVSFEIRSFETKENFFLVQERDILELEEELSTRYFRRSPLKKNYSHILGSLDLLPQDYLLFFTDLYLSWREWETFLLQVKARGKKLSLFHIVNPPTNILRGSFLGRAIDIETGDWLPIQAMRFAHEAWEKGVLKRYQLCHALGVKVHPLPVKESLLKSLAEIKFL